ncbi:unnamed protein product [Prorocentrum cordatum]|uniref:Uncharacterized protein n=1 Tax=Prorocentrum cordatum TaxID=2364126 RepID=A0ABN9QVF1_9DINO|nr:unnamed protein product [Polarella glacialis]CAK0860483.1 unnamed protein product [Polarella glacialis]
MTSDVAMPSWMVRAASPPASAPRPKRGKAGNHKEKADQLLVIIAKLALTTARQAAQLESVCYTTMFISEAEGSLGQVCRKSGIDYDGESKRLREKVAGGESVDFKARGPPHVHLFGAIIKRSMEITAPGGGTPKADGHNIFLEYWQQVTAAKKPQEIAEQSLHCKYRKARTTGEEAKGVLSFVLNSRVPSANSQYPILVDYLVKVEKAEAVHGPAPRGPLEREAGSLLQALNQF